jgi:hypothetical protein
MRRGFFWLLVMLLTVSLSGQYTTGRVEGTVLDPAGASLAGARVTLSSLDTNVSRDVAAAPDGAFHFSSVAPGRYRLAVEKSGFAPASSEITVVTSQTSTHNFTLQVGQESTTVEVHAEAAPELNAADPLRAITRTQLEIQSLPNIARNSVALLSLAPGVQPTFHPRGGALVTVSGAQAGQVAANGGRSKATSHQLDFTDANDWEFGGIALNTQPAPEMMQELRVLTNNWSAEYGVKSNAQVIMVTRSGGNNLHGTAYNFLQNDALNARDYFDRTGKPIRLKQNYFGASAGAPVVRDRTFVFGGFEVRETRGAGNTVVATLPTASARERATSAASRDLMQKYLPLPDTPTTDSDLGRLSSQLPNPASSDMFLLRGDHYFSPSHSLALRYFQHTGTSYLRLANTLPNFDATFDPNGKNAMLADTYVVSPRITNELRLAYGRSSALFTPENNLLTPRFVVLGLVSFGMTNTWPQGRIFNVYQVNDVVNIVRGRHLIKAGFDLRHIQDNSINDSNRRGVFTFASLNTFLAGQPSNYTQTFGNTYRGFRMNYHGAFVQDDIRLTPSLSINLGIRWEYQGGLREANELAAVLDSRDNSGIGSAGQGPLGSFRTTNPMIEANPALWAPRAGFNWNPGGGALVVRGGYGVYFDSLIFNGLQAGRTTPPINYIGNIAGTQIAGDNSFERLLAGTSTLQRTLESQLGSFGTLTNFGRVVTTDATLRNPYAQHFNLGVQYRISQGIVADVSYVGTKGTSLTVYGPANSVSARPAPAAGLADEQARLAEFTAAAGRQNGPGNTRLDPRFNDVDRIHSGGSSIYHSLQTELRKSFSRGLAVKASYTWSKSIDNSSDYSPGQQTIDANFAQSQFDLENERAVSSYDIPHRFVLTHVWQLPFFAGQRGIAGSILGGWSFSSINQFQSGIPATILAGPRRGITDVNMDGNFVQGGDNTRASCLADAPGFEFGNASTIPSAAARTSGLPGGFRYYQPLLGNNGTCGRNTFRMNPLVNLDWSVAKSIRLFESGPAGSGPYNLEFRTDFFNALNIPFLTATGNEWRTLSSESFGLYNAAAASRRIQMSLRLSW